MPRSPPDTYFFTALIEGAGARPTVYRGGFFVMVGLGPYRLPTVLSVFDELQGQAADSSKEQHYNTITQLGRVWKRDGQRVSVT